MGGPFGCRVRGDEGCKMAAGSVRAEQVFERRAWGMELFETQGPESLPNALVDLAALLLGHAAGRAWDRRG